MFYYLKQICDELKIFLWSKSQSPEVKSERGSAQSIVGDGNLQVAGNINYSHGKNAIEDDEDWQILIGYFNDEVLSTFMRNINDPSLDGYGRSEEGESLKKIIVEAFKKINVSSSDPRAQSLVKVKTAIISAIDVYTYHKPKDDIAFKELWRFVREQLISLCKKK